MALELCGGGGRRVGDAHDERRAQRRRLLRDHRDKRRSQRRRHYRVCSRPGPRSPATTATQSTTSSGPTRRSCRCMASAMLSPMEHTPIPSTAPTSPDRTTTRFSPTRRTARRASLPSPSPRRSSHNASGLEVFRAFSGDVERGRVSEPAIGLSAPQPHRRWQRFQTQPRSNIASASTLRHPRRRA